MIPLSPETEDLTRRLAARCGKTAEQVITDAVEAQARLSGVPVRPAPADNAIDVERVRHIARRVVARPLLDHRSAREILDEAWDNRG